MKSLSGTLKVVMVLGIGTLAVFAFRAFAQSPAQQSNPNYAAKTYELRLTNAAFKNDDEKAFNAALQKFADDQMDLTVTHKSGPASHYPPRPKVSLKTDKVTTSEMAELAAAGDLTPIGSNVVTKVSSASPQDITNVLNTLQ
jgi:hypothetical protein